MKKLLNTLYVTSDDAYLSLDGENVVISRPEQDDRRVPLHILESIVVFSYRGVSPALLGKCAEAGKNMTFLTPHGHFLAKTVGMPAGNVLLRRNQYRWADMQDRSLNIAKCMIAAKLSNSAAVLRRAVSDHSERIDDRVSEAASIIRDGAVSSYRAESAVSLRGLEGECANRYFAVFDELILQQKEEFSFHGRERNPPTDPVNAMLSFGYALMTSTCSAALETSGLDPYVGFFHTDRPGRASLALDMLEEFRAPFVDRFVLTLINKKLITDDDFLWKEDGAVLLKEESRKTFLSQWQNKKQEEITHPYLGEKVEWGMVPFVQASLLAKYIRGDLDAYPPYIWK